MVLPIPPYQLMRSSHVIGSNTKVPSILSSNCFGSSAVAQSQCLSHVVGIIEGELTVAGLVTEPLAQQAAGTLTSVERIAGFTTAARPEQLKPQIRQLYKRNILDSLACAIASLPAPPFRALREQLEELRLKRSPRDQRAR